MLGYLRKDSFLFDTFRNAPDIFIQIRYFSQTSVDVRISSEGFVLFRCFRVNSIVFVTFYIGARISSEGFVLFDTVIQTHSSSFHSQKSVKQLGPKTLTSHFWTRNGNKSQFLPTTPSHLLINPKSPNSQFLSQPYKTHILTYNFCSQPKCESNC